MSKTARTCIAIPILCILLFIVSIAVLLNMLGLRKISNIIANACETTSNNITAWRDKGKE